MKYLAKRFIAYYGKRNSRQVLLALSDRQLEDAGISKELLLKGTSHWPWRVSERPTTHDTPWYLTKRKEATVDSIADVATQQAITDLEALTDRDPIDKGISQGKIRHAVRYGAEEKAA